MLTAAKLKLQRTCFPIVCPRLDENDGIIIIIIIINLFFSLDFESVIAQQLTGKILSSNFYPKAIYFECKFWISSSAITHVPN